MDNTLDLSPEVQDDGTKVLFCLSQLNQTKKIESKPQRCTMENKIGDSLTNGYSK
eukprot:c43096_g1_i1 orf=48-212(-)